MSSIWDPTHETMSREDLAQLQLERLQAVLHRTWRSVAFYRRLFDEAGFDPDDCARLEDLARLPLTTRDALAEHQPYGMFAVPLREVVRLHGATAAGTRPAVVGHTERDIRVWSDLVARVLAAAGVTKDDVVQVAFDYGLAPVGFGFHYGAERVGASVIPTSATPTGRQVEILRDYRTTALVAPPSTALAMADHLEERGIDPKSLVLRIGLLGYEPWSEDTRRRIEQRLLIAAADNYAVSEVLGPGVAGECPERAGLHLQEDHFIAEVVDPSTGAPVPDGAEGELVLTTLTREAFPLLRFRTGDLTRIDRAACACGRTLARMARVRARTDDLVSVRGVHFYPEQVERILASVEGARPGFAIVLTREGGADQVEVHVEVSEQIFFDDMRRQRQLVETIARRLLEELKIAARVRLVEPRSIAPGGAAERVRDERPR